jgi:regulator of cell morphogenesis and NO signaling
MTLEVTSMRPSDSLARLATSRAGASRVFMRHGLDFCCKGEVSLAEACLQRGLSDAQVLEEIRREALPDEEVVAWDERPLTEIVDHVLTRFHEPHRAELPRLLEMARKVERVHAGKPTCPTELAAHLELMAEELELHMQKEEQVLFPMFLAGRGPMAAVPVQVMELEHKDHGENLARMRRLAQEFQPPSEACGTWRALYLGLAELESELMHHIHLENHVLFPLALRR